MVAVQVRSDEITARIASYLLQRYFCIGPYHTSYTALCCTIKLFSALWGFRMALIIVIR